MRIFFSTLFVVIAFAPLMGQIEYDEYSSNVGFTTSTQVYHPAQLISQSGHSRTVSCGPDTAYYPATKANGLYSRLPIDGFNIEAIAQYYDAPQPLSISGMVFHAYSNDPLPIQIQCAVYAAGPDSLPSGIPLAFTTYSLPAIPNPGGNVFLAEQIVTFSNPVAITGPYVLVLTNPNLNTDARVYGNSISMGDGDGEWLSSVKSGPWIRSYDITFPNGDVLNADFLLFPIFTYDLTTEIQVLDSCDMQPDSNFFFAQTSPIATSRFYHDCANGNNQQAAWNWFYGDGKVGIGQSVGHAYQTKGDHLITLTTKVGYKNVCTDTATFYLPGVPDGSIGLQQELDTAFFNSQATNVNSWLWDFGDGSPFDTTANPTHIYPAPAVIWFLLPSQMIVIPLSSRRILRFVSL